MDWYIRAAVRLIRAAGQIYERKWSFLGIFAFVFFGCVIMLERLDLLPNPPQLSSPPAAILSTSPVITTQSVVSIPEEPIRIQIPKIKLGATIANPTSIDETVLDAALLKGAVRYPTSAKLGEAGNVVLFGHSSYLPVVGNPAYKTFDEIQKLVAGDVITVYSAGSAYEYRVRNVSKESAASDAGINLAVTGRVLTLATCNSFGAKTDRFIVTADFVESHSIPN
jgi:LPXTG-site transpeptidase (sortase) family protein